VWAQVWLAVDDDLALAATWPPDATPASTEQLADPRLEADGRRSLSVRQAGQLLGVLVVQERSHIALTSVEERLFAGLADQAGLVLRGARLRAELSRRRDELSARADELRLSRQRLVDAHDAERSRLERDIHDGAQQHLVALAVNLRLAHTLMQRSPDRAAPILAEQEQAAVDTVETLVSLSRGIYPRLLSDAGLPAAFAAAGTSSPLLVEVTGDGIGRFAANVEAAFYFCGLEALQNAAKHAKATKVQIALAGGPDALTLTVVDDGVGFDPPTTQPGSGLANMRDRIEAVGGVLSVDTGTGSGTRVVAELRGRPISEVGAA
jgi:signal transduction histidine kinase